MPWRLDDQGNNSWKGWEQPDVPRGMVSCHLREQSNMELVHSIVSKGLRIERWFWMDNNYRSTKGTKFIHYSFLFPT